MVDPTAFTDPENWTGGWYELALELGQRCDERLDHALRVLWRDAGIVGCVGLQDQEPTEREVVGFSPVIYGEVQHIPNHHAAGRDVSFAVLVGHRR